MNVQLQNTMGGSHTYVAPLNVVGVGVHGNAINYIGENNEDTIVITVIRGTRWALRNDEDDYSTEVLWLCHDIACRVQDDCFEPFGLVPNIAGEEESHAQG